MNRIVAATALIIAGVVLGASAHAADIAGRVLGAGAPIANSTVTLWETSAGAPQQLAQTRTGADGRFTLTPSRAAAKDSTLYLVAQGGQPTASKTSGDNAAIVLIAVLGATPPANVVINEFTTVASVWTHNQFIDGTAIKGHALGLKIAAGNVPSFVDLASGGWGGIIQDPLNSGQTPTMANFATLANVLAACVTRVTPDACSRLFAAATPPKGSAPTDTLTAAESIARYPWYRPERVFALLELYPIPSDKTMRAVPYMPYLQFPPSAWVLPLKFDGGGYRAGGKAMFDSEGNLWVGDNFTIGWQARDALWQGNASKFDPNGKPLSPITTGFAGGGMQGGTFGAAIDMKDNAWLASYGGKSIAVFDKNGKPLTPPEGITFDGKLGLMQGIIVVPGTGDVWALGLSKGQLLFFPGADYTKGRIVCEGRDVEPCKSFLAPFHLAIDQQNRIWVTNGLGGHVTRFPASDPSKVEKFSTGWSGSGLNIDSQGNVWVTNRLGNSVSRTVLMAELLVTALRGGNPDPDLSRAMSKQTASDGGSVTLLKPDGSQYPGSPFTAGGLPGPWAVVVDGNDNVWISNFAMPNSPITQLCGARTENCPPGFKTGDQIAPPNGYVGGGLQMQTDLAISPSGDVWVMNNWQDIDSCFGVPDETLSTRCGGQGVVIFFGMAKPVRAPQIGPARPY
jgi:streptogramin lyase